MNAEIFPFSIPLFKIIGGKSTSLNNLNCQEADLVCWLPFSSIRIQICWMLLREDPADLQDTVATSDICVH